MKALVERCFQAGDSAIRDTALETGFRLGFPAAILSCRRLAEEAEPGVGRALQLLAMTGDPADVVRIEKTLEVKALRDSALVALGYSGRKSSVEPVLSAMKDAKTARLAGEAFWAITGIAVEGELVSQDVDDSEEPPSFEADDLDANLVPGPEAELPLPNAELAARRWRTVSNGLDPALRYLHGKPFTLEGLVQCFAGAPMRRRHLLALELSVHSRGGFLVGTHENRLEPDDRAARGAPSPEQYRQPDCTLTLDDNSKVVIDCKFTDANGRPDEWGTKPGMGGRTQEPDYRDINKSQGNDIGEPKLDKNNCECGKRKLETEEIRVTEPALQPENRFYFAPMPGSPVPLPAPGVAPAPLPGGFPIPELVFP